MTFPAHSDNTDPLEISPQALPPNVLFGVEESGVVKRSMIWTMRLLWLATSIGLGVLMFDGIANPPLGERVGFIAISFVAYLGLQGLCWLYPLAFEFNHQYAHFTMEHSRIIKLEPDAKLVICSYKMKWWKVYSSHNPKKWVRVRKKWFPELPLAVKKMVEHAQKNLQENPDFYS